MNSQAKSDKVLTPEYLDWYSKLTDLPTMISDKLYKTYKEKTRLDPWIKSETSESPQSKNADNHILQDSSLKTQVRILQMNVVPISPKQQFPISVLPKDLEEKQKHVIKMVLE